MSEKEYDRWNLVFQIGVFSIFGGLVGMGLSKVWDQGILWNITSSAVVIGLGCFGLSMFVAMVMSDEVNRISDERKAKKKASVSAAKSARSA